MEADGRVRSVYCHHDGYLEGVGRTLLDHYTDPDKIDSLLALGDLSSLGDDPETPGECIAYMRDHGETDCPATESINLDDALAIDTSQEFYYVWENGSWSVWSDGLVRFDLTAAITAATLNPES